METLSIVVSTMAALDEPSANRASSTSVSTISDWPAGIAGTLNVSAASQSGLLLLQMKGGGPSGFSGGMPKRLVMRSGGV